MSLTIDDITVGELRSEYVDRLVQKHHYLDRVPTAPTIYRYLITGGLQYGIVGAAMWGKPIAREEDQETTLELLRFWTEDYTPHNAESKALGEMIRDIDSKSTHKRLIAYASTGQDHDGTIYKATNWTDLGVREYDRKDGWANRDGRAAGDQSNKRKFEYLLD